MKHWIVQLLTLQILEVTEMNLKGQLIDRKTNARQILSFETERITATFTYTHE